MKKSIVFGLLLCLFYSQLLAKHGIEQKHLSSIQSNRDSIVVVYDLPIDESSLHKKLIKVKSKSKGKKSKEKFVKGTLELVDTYSFRYAFDKPLEDANYVVKIKPVVLLDFPSNIDSLPFYLQFIYECCSWFYDDVKECKLWKYIWGKHSKPIKFTMNYTDAAPHIISLSLSQTSIMLEENNTTFLDVNATYDDNTSQIITNEVDWVISTPDVITISGNTITAIKEGQTSLKATKDGTTSSEVNVHVFKQVNGHILPLEPDETLNNSTLLGIDSNNNGVRDDVERKILIEIPTEIKKQVFFQGAKNMQARLADQDLIVNAKVWAEEPSDKYFGCKKYIYRKYDINIKKSIGFLEEVTFNTNNTKERILKYSRYNNALSGGVYWTEENYVDKTSCDFNITKALEMDQ